MTRLVLLAPVLLAACGADTRNTAAPTEQQQADAPVRDVDSIPADETAAAAVGEDDDAPAGASAIPAAFQGRWGLTPADCDPARADNKGLMTVTADTLTFYESRGRLESVAGSGPDRFSGRFALTGEGQSWTRDVVLTRDGAALLRQDEEITTPLRYARCS